MFSALKLFGHLGDIFEIELAGGGGAAIGYVAEDGVTQYVAENGTDDYVTE